MNAAEVLPDDYDTDKLQALIQRHGAGGLGIFWFLTGLLYREKGGRLPLLSCGSVARELHAKRKTVESVVEDFGLFEHDGTFFWSASVLARLDRRKATSEKRRQAAEARWRKKAPIKEETGKEETKHKEVEQKETKRFCPPKIEEVRAYAEEKEYVFFDAERFIDFYASKGWMVGKNKMKDWRAAVRNWVKTDKMRRGAFGQSGNQNVNDLWEK